MRDGHIHTPYCPHGTADSFKSYIEKAISIGYDTMTFTEHAPLPTSFVDPVPEKDSGMALAEVESYLSDINRLQKEYKDDISIQAGFEVDYIEGYERETETFLNRYGPELDDSILSVHFIKGNSQWYCIDYSPDMYEEALHDLGGSNHLYQAYFNNLRKSAEADLGAYKPSRIGHMTLIRKFKDLYPSPPGWEVRAEQFLKVLKEQGLELDYNGAGLQKPHCKETYPPKSIADQASSMGLPLVYGSDAHAVSGLKQGFSEIDPRILSFNR